MYALRICKYHQYSIPWVILLFILNNCLLDCVSILYEEIQFWSFLGLEGIIEAWLV